MEQGFYHPSRGYWQTTGTPTAEALATYPQGTEQIPVKPSNIHEWNGSEWVEVQPPIVVPKIVTMRQARLALLGAGLLPTVEAAINALAEPARTAARIEWDYSSEVHLNKPFVQSLSVAIGLTQEQLNNLFIQASQIP